MFKLPITACLMGIASLSYAQSFVSAATGNDTNLCTRTAPCRTYQRALNVTPAWSEIHVLDVGDYGPATITQAVTIDGKGLGSSMGTSGAIFTVNAPAGAVVQLRNLAIHGDGASTGIVFDAGAQLHLDNVKVTGISGSCIEIVPQGSGTSDVSILNSSIDNCSSAGIYFAYPEGVPEPVVTASIVNSHVHFANTGIVVTSGSVSITGSTFTAPGSGAGQGIATYNWGNGTYVMVDNCLIAGYGVGLAASAPVQVSRTTFSQNTTAMGTASGGTITSNGNNAFFNNTYMGSFTRTVALQ